MHLGWREKKRRNAFLLIVKRDQESCCGTEAGFLSFLSSLYFIKKKLCRLCNFVGILNQGLRIAPPEAPTSGFMFGKGVYFGDRVEKSGEYCYPQENDRGLLLVSDVALGESFEVKKPQFISSLPDGKKSTLALGKIMPDEKKEEVVEDKVVVPMVIERIFCMCAHFDNGVFREKEYLLGWKTCF